MRYASLFIVAIALLSLTAYSPAALADELEDLEVTMEVVDDAADIEEAISRMRGPDDDIDDERYWAYDNIESYDEGGTDESGETSDRREDDFEMEDEFEEDRDFEEDIVEDEDDFEDGEDVDDDFEDDDDSDDDSDDDDGN